VASIAPLRLYRYPGPCGLADWFAGALTRLGPPGSPLLWLSAAPFLSDCLGARCFGTLALADARPFAPAPVRGRPGIFIGDNRLLGAGDEVAWIAPAGRDRARCVDELCRYLEELDAMRRSGAPGPGVPWCHVPRAERRQRLAAAGVRGVWTEAEGGIIAA
jgi:hypothetical protein